MRRIRVMVVDDVSIVRRLVSNALGADPDIEVVGAAANGRINRRDFGINFTQILDNNVIGVADEVLIQIDVELVRQPN